LAAHEEFFDISKPSVRRSMTLLAGGALIGLVIAGYGLFTAKGTRSHAVPPEAVALVNQRQILRSDFMTQTQTQFVLPFAETSLEQRRTVLEDMINEELMVQRGLEIDLPSYDPDVRNALVAGVELEVTADVLAEQPTPEEMRAYYEHHKGAAQPAEAAHAAALAAVAALRHGQTPDAVIKKFNLVDSGRFMDAGHADTGDIFQFALRAKLDDALYQATLPLHDGEVSDPVEESDGVHLIAMIKHRFPVAQTFEEASSQVWTDVKKEAQAKVRSANLAYLRSRADIMTAPEFAQ
jgi:hypothetical protein